MPHTFSDTRAKFLFIMPMNAAVCRGEPAITSREKKTMASTQSEALKVAYRSLLEAMGKDPNMPLDEQRVIFEHIGDVTGEPGGVDYFEVDANGVSALWAVPKGCAQDRVILCTHGGGYVYDSMYSHRKLYAHLAKATGCRSLSLDYRLAPEHPHPAPVQDAVRAYEWLLAQGIKPAHIATSGDSAGGGLCVAAVLATRDRQLPLPAAILPISPWVDMEVKGESMKTKAAVDAVVQAPLIEALIGLFLAGGSRQDPLANPLYADFKGMPPMYIQVGEDETLLDDAKRLTAHAKAAGVEVKLDIYPEMQHVFHFLAGTAPEADRAIAQQAAWLKPKLGLA